MGKHCMSRRNKQHTDQNSITVPISVQNEQTLVLLYAGEDRSSLDIRFVQSNKLSVESVHKGQVTLVAGDAITGEDITMMYPSNMVLRSPSTPLKF